MTIVTVTAMWYTTCIALTTHIPADGEFGIISASIQQVRVRNARRETMMNLDNPSTS